MSEAAYALGGFFDPDNVRCIDHVGHCALCGEATPYVEGAVQQAGFVCPDCKSPHEMEPPNIQPAFDLAGEVQDIRSVTIGLQAELDDVNQQLVSRGNALVKTRAQLSQVQTDVSELRGDVQQWRSSMSEVHRQIRERDAQRLATLTELARSLQEAAR